MKASTHRKGLISVHVGVNQLCRSLDVESPASLLARSLREHKTPALVVEEKSSKGQKATTHPPSLVIVDVGVYQLCRARRRDVESPAGLPPI